MLMKITDDYNPCYLSTMATDRMLPHPSEIEIPRCASDLKQVKEDKLEISPVLLSFNDL